MYIPATDNVVKGYEIDNSLRFNDNDSAYLSRTPASAGNRKTWAWAGWVKRGNLGAGQAILDAGDDTGDNYTRMDFNGSDQLYILWSTNTTNTHIATTNAKYRDAGAWYHVLLSVDTTQATASNRVRVYVNGEEATLNTTTQAPQNHDTHINSTAMHTIGKSRRTDAFAVYLDGYLSDVHFIDGQALTPDSFGEFGDYGEFKPIAYTGTYGTNGSILEFKDAGDLGADTSGNNNDWTPTNLAATDQMLDTPTNNFCTLNPLDSTVNNLSEGNLRLSTATSGSRTACGTFSVVAGKWYWEVESLGGSENFIGLIDAAYTGTGSTLGYKHTSGSVFYYRSGQKRLDDVVTSYGASYTTNDVISVALDLAGGTVTFYKNNVSQGAITLPTTGGGIWKPCLSSGTSGANQVYFTNFGQEGYTYSPPSGYLALCTKNLDEPTVIPSEHFNTVLYTGDGTSSHAITGVGFAPDWVWTKGRSSSRNHSAYDSLRGVSKRLQSSTTGAEATVSGVTAFGSDGFTLGDDLASNENAQTFAAWNWKANGAGVSNTDGSITSTVSANVDAGFSIVGYTGNGSASQTVGHGLSKAPDFIIVKRRSDTGNWVIWTTAVDGSFDYGYLDATNAFGSEAGNSPPTASVFGVNGPSTVQNANGSTYISYCFHSVDGYSKFGSYTGNGSTDGPFIPLNFRPAYVMVKRTDVAANWGLFDGKRNGSNIDNDILYPNLSNVEGDAEWIDLTSNGFKLRYTHAQINASGGSYIFIAFAEIPFSVGGGIAR